MCCITFKRGVMLALLFTQLYANAQQAAPEPGATAASSPSSAQPVLDALISTTTSISEPAPQPPAPVSTATVAQPTAPVVETEPTPAVSFATTGTPDTVHTTTASSDVSIPPQEESPLSIDTMNIAHETKGNWLYKRFWWERARKLYDEIINRVKSVQATGNSFTNQYMTILNTVFADFYKKSGYQQGELDTILTKLKADLEEKQTKQVTLNEQERAAFAALEKEKEQLDQLHTHIQAVGMLASSYEEAINLLNQQIALCNSYEQQAAGQLQEIERELNDKQAKESYHQIRTAFENITTIESYLKGDFARYFATLATKTQEHIPAVMELLAALKERGIDLMKQVEKMRDQACATQKETVVDEQKIAEPESQGITHWFSNMWTTIRDAVYSGFAWVRSFWSSSKTTHDEKNEAAQQ